MVHQGTIANEATVHEHEGVGEVAVEEVQEVVKDEYEVRVPQQLRSSKDGPVAVASAAPSPDASLVLGSLLQQENIIIQYLLKSILITLMTKKVGKL